MGDLGDRLNALTEPVPGQPYTAAGRDRVDPVEVEYLPGGGIRATGVVAESIPDESQWRTLAAGLGLNIPDDWLVRLVRAKHDPAAWHRDGVGEDAVTRAVWRLEFAIDPPSAVADRVDLDAMFARVRKDRPKNRAETLGTGALVLSWNDWQLYKSDGDGIAGTVDRLVDGFDATVDRKRELGRLKRPVSELVIVGNGDIVEGCDIFPNQAWQLQGDLRDQVNAARRLIVQGVRTLAPHFDRVTVLAVGGNHGENRRGGKAVNRHDNLDAAVFEQAAEVIGANEDAYGHVRFLIPREDLAATVKVQGHILGVTHGHLARQSGGTEGKLRAWYDRMAGDKQPIGQADVLLSAHYHHLRVADWGGCAWVQAPAIDGGSPHFTDSYGGASRPGLLTFAMYPDRRMTDLAIL
jgi:hypothetical protein